MNLLEFSKQAIEEMENITSGEEYAKYYVKKKGECFDKFQRHLKQENENNKFTTGLIMSGGHGTNFFHDVVEWWDNPDGYATKQKDEKGKYILPDYNWNFVVLLKESKKEDEN